MVRLFFYCKDFSKLQLRTKKLQLRNGLYSLLLLVIVLCKNLRKGCKIMKKIKMASIVFTGSLAISLTLSPVSEIAKADTYESIQNENTETGTLDKKEEKIMQDNFKEAGWNESKGSDGSITYTISDESLANNLRKRGYTEEAESISPKVQTEAKSKKGGVNSFKYNGHGRYTLKLSRTVTRAVVAVGAGGAGLLLARIPGVGKYADRLGSAVIGSVSGSSIKSGVVLKGSLGDGRGGMSVTSWHWQ